MGNKLRLKNHFKENKLFINRTIIATSIISFMILVLISRLIYLQVSQHEIYATQAHKNQVRIVPIAAPRGLIYAKNGELLAENKPSYSLEINTQNTKNVNNLINRLSKVIAISNEDKETFKKKLKYKGIFDSVPIKTRVTEEEVAKFVLQQYQFPEVNVIARLNRHYTYDQIASHLLGYTAPISDTELKNIDVSRYRGMQNIGKLGIEKSYEDILHGKPGYEQVETDARGRIIKTLDTTPPIAGQDIVLSLDIKLQKYAYEQLGNHRGAIVALEPRTGNVLAMVSKPSFDSNQFVQGVETNALLAMQNNKAKPLFNRAIAGQYPPGSTIKPIVAIQALEHKIVDPQGKIFDPGYYQISDETRVFRNWKRKGHGAIDLENALAESCTTYFYYLADKLGIERLSESFTRFGLGKPTGINIHGEAQGIAPSSKWKWQTYGKPWYTGETLNTGIGQGHTLVTPIQLAVMTSTLANQGKHIQPNLITGIKKNGVVESTVPPTSNIIHLKDHSVWHTIISGMELTIKSPRGTAHRIYRPRDYTIAGKTGTAQVYSLKEDETYDASKIKEELRDHGWFIAFAPVEDPKIAIAVIMENSKGSSVVAKKVIDYYLGGIKK